MGYDDLATFRVEIDGGVAWARFDDRPANVHGLPMLADLTRFADSPKRDRAVEVVVASAHPEIAEGHARLESGPGLGKVVVES